MRKSPVENIEELLIQLQYALADYYTSVAREGELTFDSLDASLSELRKDASSVQLAIRSIARHAQKSEPYPAPR